MKLVETAITRFSFHLYSHYLLYPYIYNIFFQLCTIYNTQLKKVEIKQINEIVVFFGVSEMCSAYKIWVQIREHEGRLGILELPYLNYTVRISTENRDA